MKQGKPLHPADTAELASIAQATGFMASMFLGRGRYAKSPQSPSLAGARYWAILLRHHCGGQRLASVYAILPTGKSVLVPNDFNLPTNEETIMSKDIKTFSSKSNAQRSAKAAIGQHAKEGEHFHTRLFNDGDLTSGWVWNKGAAVSAKVKGEKRSSKAAKEPKMPKEPKAPKAPKPLGKRAAAEAAARDGVLPTPPDFSAETHKRYRGKLDELNALVAQKDVPALKAYEINPVSTSPKALARYRDLCVIAIEADKDK